MNTDGTYVTPEIARHVLWAFDAKGGWQPGSFTQHLIRAASAADITNKANLAIAYPGYVAAVTIAQFDTDGIAFLQRLADGIRCTRCKDADGPFADSDGEPLCDACAAPQPLSGGAL
jgi:hypothetical protein